MKRKTKTTKKEVVNEEVGVVGTEEVEVATEETVEVATGESEAKKELRAYIENLKATDAHEYAVREARLLKELNNLK